MANASEFNLNQLIKCSFSLMFSKLSCSCLFIVECSVQRTLQVDYRKSVTVLCHFFRIRLQT